MVANRRTDRPAPAPACPPAYLPTCLSVCLPVCLSVCPPVWRLCRQNFWSGPTLQPGENEVSGSSSVVSQLVLVVRDAFDAINKMRDAFDSTEM